MIKVRGIVSMFDTLTFVSDDLELPCFLPYIDSSLQRLDWIPLLSNIMYPK
jgi:hypothetical protein